MEHHDLILFLLQVAIMLFVALGAGQVMRRLGQPAVVGELIGGILLGPTLFGALAPSAYGWLFPPLPSLTVALDAVIKLGMLFFLFSAGLEVNLARLKGRGITTIVTSVSGIVVPFCLGFGAVWLFPSLWGGAPSLTLALFMGAALSITALPVIARILVDLKLIQAELGALIMASAMINDLLGWTLFALILSRVAPTTLASHGPWVTVLLVCLYCVAVVGGGRWATGSVLPWLEERLEWPSGFIAATAIAMLAVGIVAELVGIHAFFGAFLLGVGLAQGQDEHHEAYETIYQFAASLLAPLYFVSIGLKANFLANFDPMLVLLVLLVASLGKVVGVSVAARASGLPTREALAVGFGMNARGAMEIILASMALEFGLIDQRIFVALVIMAVVTSMISGPAIKWLLSPTPAMMPAEDATATPPVTAAG